MAVSTVIGIFDEAKEEDARGVPKEGMCRTAFSFEARKRDKGECSRWVETEPCDARRRGLGDGEDDRERGGRKYGADVDMDRGVELSVRSMNCC